MLKSLSIQKKMVAALGGIALLNAVAGGTTSVMSYYGSSSLSDLTSVQEVAENISHLEHAANDVHRTMVNLINSGDIKMRAEIKEKYALVEEYADSLLEMMEGAHGLTFDAEHREGVHEMLVDVHDELHEWYDDVATVQLSHLEHPDSVDVARLMEASPQNVALWEDLDEDFAYMNKLMGEVTAHMANATSSRLDVTLVSSVLAIIITLIATISAALYTTFSVTRPLNKLTEVTKRLEAQEWHIDVPYRTRSDEVGDLAEALEKFKVSGQMTAALQKKTAEEAERQSERTLKIEESIAHFDHDSKLVFDKFEAVSKHMQSTSNDMSTVTEQTRKITEAVTKGAQKADENVSQVSKSTDVITKAFTQISEDLTQTNSDVMEVHKVTREATDRLNALNKSSEDINNVIALISDVAEQTQLLALNARIEAARAGENGKGFAVVANEVKDLASDTDKATSEVREKIEAIAKNTHEATAFMSQIEELIAVLSERLGSTSDVMSQQAQMATEINENAQNAARETSDVSLNMDKVMAENAKAQKSAQQVNASSSDITDQIKNLKKAIENFTSNIKSS